MTLDEFAKKTPRAVLAFSGGSDSAFLLYMSRQLRVEWIPVYVKSAFQPAFELEDAKRLAEELKTELKVLTLDVLSDPDISHNPPERCYACKRWIMRTLQNWGEKNGFHTVIDGTNASDAYDDRPGMRALGELKIRSPLRLCGITKMDVRRYSREAGLFTWNKPSYACLATRIPTNEPITEEKLHRVETAENALRALGFRDFRLRTSGNTAKLQVTEAQLYLAFTLREEVCDAVKPQFSEILLDLEPRTAEKLPGGE